MRLRFWGVRGSIPVPGTETSRYGGNTSCLEIYGEGLPSLVLDCGTGARRLGPAVLQRPERELFMVFTHFHMDHLFGFPFFAPIYAPSFDINVTAPAFHPEGAKDRVSRYLNGIFHPVRSSEVPARIVYDAIRPRRPFQRGPYLLEAIALNHPGGSCGYRVEHNGRVVVYVTDTAPLSRPGEGMSGGMRPTGRELHMLDLFRGADAVVFDTMFTVSEYLEKMTWGHSFPEYAVALCREAGVKRLYLFHHAPDASDDQLDALGAAWAHHVDPVVIVAREGMDISFEG